MEVLYGLHPVEEAVRSGARRLDCVLLARERGDARLERLAQLCRDAGIRVTLESRDQLTRLARTDAHQGPSPWSASGPSSPSKTSSRPSPRPKP